MKKQRSTNCLVTKAHLDAKLRPFVTKAYFDRKLRLFEGRLDWKVEDTKV